MTKKRTPKAVRRKKVSTQSVSSVDKVGKPMPGDLTHDAITRRAYQIWCQPNYDLKNWHEAEKQLHDERTSPRRE